MKCSGCLKLVKEDKSIKCTASVCSKHFCSACINLTVITSDFRKIWKCPECCAANKKGGDNSGTPVRSASVDPNVTLRSKSQNPHVSPLEFNPSEIRELTSEVRLLTSEISSLKHRLEEATQSLTKCHARLDEIESSFVASEGRVKILEKENKEQLQQIINLKLNVSLLQRDLASNAQAHLKNEVEISGIPETTNENLTHIALLAARKIGVELVADDIDWVTRVGKRVTVIAGKEVREVRPIVVRLIRKTKRDQIVRAAKFRKNVVSSDLDVPGPPNRVFYNERLTKDNRLLFREARARSKLHKFAHCWCNQGTILVRQGDGKPAHRVTTQEDLDRIIGPASADIITQPQVAA